MKTNIFIAVFITFTFSACDNASRQEKPKQETPKALEDKTVSSEIVSKRGYDDLVESLYSELLDRNAGLKSFENQIQELNESKDDSTELFDNFNNKNGNYYSTAIRHIDQISDSTLKSKMKTLISKSLVNYESSITRHSALMKSIEARQITLNDLHIALKITNTLYLIGKYQSDNLPPIRQMEGFIQHQDRAIKLADTLSKK
jgi:hypothetical protein